MKCIEPTKNIFLARTFDQNVYDSKQFLSPFIRPYGTVMALSDQDCAMKCTVGDEIFNFRYDSIDTFSPGH